MVDVFRTPEENFAGLRDFDFEPHWHDWEGLRVHYLDEGPREAPVMLLLHGMPTWSYLYRDVIPPLVAAGFRCIAPDHLGFGKSDKPGALSWYSIAPAYGGADEPHRRLGSPGDHAGLSGLGRAHGACPGGHDARAVSAPGHHEYLAAPRRL
jgi:haloalkane dehalogenase